ncbi:MAG TPA: PD-(D/E)XK nuclease family protein [Acidobacteriaceae bacterium]|nr:PD-(D/E)XK nuclease family protein [Acidobacteriaceae bacterium]
MSESFALPLQVLEALERGWVVLTANQRAARTLRRAFEARQRAAGLASWAPPQILAWDSWLVLVYRQMVAEGRATDLLLNDAQEHTLWRAIVSEDAATSSLRPVDALAESAAIAWTLLHAYRARARLRSYIGNSDTRVFTAWVTEFERRLKRGQLITAAQLPERLRESAAAGQAGVSAGLLLAGFDTKTPAQEALLTSLKAGGCDVQSLTRTLDQPMLQLAVAASEQEELQACANWVRTKLEQNPGAQIAVIVPAIEPLRAAIDRQFRLLLAPELNEIASSAMGPYEFSLGVPLAHIAMVATAMDILRWSQGALPFERISSLLLSRYFAVGDSDERLARGEFDAFVLRRQKLLQPRLSVDALHRLASGSKAAPGISQLISHLAALRSAFGAPELPLLRTHGEWAETIADMLSAAGWAPTTHLDSAEFQTRRKWESVLDELTTLDFDDQHVPFINALSSLEHIVQRTLFAPESHHAPVQIMGPLEAAGSTFDAIWFLRANDQDWSTLSSPNPLLPWPMQRDLRMPGAVPAQDAAVAQAVTERSASSAAEVVFSYARESAAGPQRPSPALGALVLQRGEASAVLANAADTPEIELEFISEPAVPPPPPVVLHGGAGVLEKQAACAFRAFAEARLFSTPLDTVALGLDAGERGSIVHRVLQLFWTRVRSQAELLAMPIEARHVVLDECIHQAIAERARSPEPGWSKAYIETERQRLRNLLRPWLQYEADERTPFVVKAVEDEHTDVTIGPVHLHVKVDRVDEWLADDRPAGDIILDYKTGIANPTDWLGDRPDAPQLPLYAVVAGTQELAGIAFASVRPGKGREMKGFASRKDVLPKVPRDGVRDLQVQVKEWRAVLTSLAEDFHAGKAEVRPKNYPETCKYCQQRTLCRLDVSSLSADETEEADDVFFEEDNG